MCLYMYSMYVQLEANKYLHMYDNCLDYYHSVREGRLTSDSYVLYCTCIVHAIKYMRGKN